MIKREFSLKEVTLISKRKISLLETETILKERVKNYFGFMRIEYLRYNRWRTQLGRTVNTNDAWDLMDFYQKPLPF